MGLLIFYLVLAIAVSFLCSILEAVILSVTPSFIALKEQEDPKGGALLRNLKEDIDRPLSSILTLNTIAHTVGAAGVGAQAQVVFGNAYVSLTSAVLTLVILIFSEIIPKTLGATYWKSMAAFAAGTTRILIWLTYPFVKLSEGITRWLGKSEKEPSLSREEFSAMADQGVQEGVFEEGESNVFKNLITFSSLKVEDIMTPRIVVVKHQQDKTIQEILSEKELQVSRMPLFGTSEEDITGYILKIDLYSNLAKGNGDKKLKEIKREVLIVPEKSSVKVLLDRLLETQEHIAVVVDEYGGLAGVVTMEDVIETLLGIEIVDEIDAIEDMQKLAREKWRHRAERLGIVIPEITLESEEEPEED
ncbi:MAG: hemolysin family protein [Balneolales bacterium]|nr:hemolysin family protein [Balneolales bacterium]